jgi:hypothetical protein
MDKEQRMIEPDDKPDTERLEQYGLEPATDILG